MMTFSPANTRHEPLLCLLAHRLRRFPSIEPTVAQCLVLLGTSLSAYYRVDTIRRPDIGLMLVHRPRRCPSIKPTSVQRLIFPRIAMVNIQALVFMNA